MLALTYHAIGRESSPLAVDPALFEQHLDRIVDAGARVVTVHELAKAIASGDVTEPTVAITFDDGFASVAETAAPLLEQRGLTATVFCVAGHLGGLNDWPSSPSGGLRDRLATASDLTGLAAAGFEIGSHGMHHEPLVQDAPELLRREIVDSRHALEDAVHVAVTSFAYPYGAAPAPAAKRLVERTYGAACSTVVGRPARGADVYALPRIDAHYLRRPELLSRALTGSLEVYLQLRRVSARARRLVRKDYVALGAQS